MTELAVPNQLFGLGQSMSLAVERKDGKTAGKIVEDVEKLVKAADALKLDTAKYNRIVEQHFWSARMLGLLLNEICPHGGDRPSKITLRDLDISPQLSSFARKCAEIHQEDARTYFAEMNSDRANISYLLRLHTESENPPVSGREATEKRLAKMLALCIETRQDYYATEREKAACVAFEEALDAPV